MNFIIEKPEKTDFLVLKSIISKNSKKTLNPLRNR
jgi:hypothetical protein